MPMPRWVAHMNKRTVNPREVARGERPVIIHVGRTSGREYQTPLDAHAVDGGYLFLPMYGVNSDWVRNVTAAGSARLRVDGAEVPLTAPRLIDEEAAFALLPKETRRPPKWLKLKQYLLADLAR